MLQHWLRAAALLILFGSESLQAGVDPEVSQAVQERLESALPGLQVTSVAESPFPGVFTVETQGQETIYTTADGEHLVVGELFRLAPGGLVNVSETRRAEQRAASMEQVPAEQMITYPAKGETRARIKVFTDIDCPYCRKLHAEIPALNDMGVEVSYLAFPRSGPNTPSFAKAVSAWCAEDPPAAMNRAKGGQQLQSRTCENPVAEQFRLGREVGITGTPAIVLESGQLIGGYVPKDRLAQALGL